MSFPSAPSDLFVDGVWRRGHGAPFPSQNRVTGDAVWSGAAARAADVDLAVRAARAAIPAWRDRSVEDRRGVI